MMKRKSLEIVDLCSDCEENSVKSRYAEINVVSQIMDFKFLQ